MEYKLIIPDLVYQKIMWWMNKANFEVSGFGSLDYDHPTRTFTVRDAILLKQEVGPASTEIDPVAIGKAMYEMREEPNALKWHWHSHVDMGVFWSGDDRTLIHNLGSQGWILATVFNRKHERKTAFLTTIEVMGEKETYFIDDIETRVKRLIDQELCSEWDRQYEEKVKQAPVAQFGGYLGGSRWSSGGQGNLDDTDWNSRLAKREGFVENSERSLPEGVDMGKLSYTPNKEGWRYSHMFKRAVYNPLFDESLTTEEEKLAMIFTMDAEEVEAAFHYDPGRGKKYDFDRLYEKALKIHKAQQAADAEEERLANIEEIEDDTLQERLMGLC